MSIPPRFLDQIRGRLSLSDVIGKRIKITRAGREYKACCPFHKEKTPSFTINDEKQFYHCFGCGAHGDVIKFIMEHDNLSFIDTVENLAAQAGLSVPQQTAAEVKQAKTDKSLYALVDEASKWFESKLFEQKNKEALQYLLERGITLETIKAFRIGYAPDDATPLREKLSLLGYKDAQMIEAGIMRAAKEGHKSQAPYGFFRERIMFPVADKRGRIVAFGGRILPEHIRPPGRGDFKPPKYINSSDTPIFNKGWILYGENIARKAVADGQDVLVVEGYMDVIACHQAGFEGAVAPMGTALTEDQIMALWKMIPKDAKGTPRTPILCFDGDNAGRRAAERACERIIPLLRADQSVKIAFLPQDEDPDTLIRSGGKGAFRKILGGALSLFDYIWSSHTAGRHFDTPESKAGVTKALNILVSRIADHDVQRYYQQQIKERISQFFFARPQNNNWQQNKGRNNTYGKGAAGKISLLKPKRPALRQKQNYYKILLAAAINHPRIFDGIEEQLCTFEIHDPRMNTLRENIVSALSDNPDLDSRALQEHLKQEGYKKEIGDILNESVYVHASFCAPTTDSGLVESKWKTFYKDVQGMSLNKEIKTGWKNAFDASNEEGEEKVRNLLRARTAQDDYQE